MAQINHGIRNVLARPEIYDRFQGMVGARKFRKAYVAEHVCPKKGAKILDIGCGTGEILEFFQDSVEYHGYDQSESYICSARARYGERGRWYCSPVAEIRVEELETFDIVMANGVFHHLDDAEADQLARIAAHALKPGGRLCSFDGCFTEDQGRIARYLVSKDRGQNIREPEGYRSLVQPYFASVELFVKHRMLRIPYSHAIIIATKAGAT